MKKLPKACFFKEVEFRLLRLKHFSFDYLECIGQLRESTGLRATNLIRENCFAKHKFIQISSLFCMCNVCQLTMSPYHFALRAL